MANDKVQEAAGAIYAASLTVTLPAASTPGNLLVLVVEHASTSSVTVTDSAGNTWAQKANTSASGATGASIGSIWVCEGAASATTVTITRGAVGALIASVSEWSGAGAFRGASAAVATSSPVTAAAGDLVIGGAFFYQATRSATLSGGWTALSDGDVTTTHMAAAYDDNATTGSTGPSWTIAATVGTATIAYAAYAAPDATSPLFPDSVVSNAGAATNVGGAASLQAALADTSDATLMRTAGLGVDEVTVIGFSGTLADGRIGGPFRARLPAGSTARYLRLEVLDGSGATVRATRTYDLAGVTDFADFDLSLTDAESDSVVSRTGMAVRITGNPT